MTYYVLAEFHMEGVQDPRLSYMGELVIAKFRGFTLAHEYARETSRNEPSLVATVRDRLEAEYQRRMFVRYQTQFVG